MDITERENVSNLAADDLVISILRSFLKNWAPLMTAFIVKTNDDILWSHVM